MMELVAHLPGGRTVQGVYEPAGLEDAQVYLRPFDGEISGWKKVSSAVGEAFWANFGQDEGDRTGCADQASYMNHIADAVSYIQRHEMNKVVLSRKWFWPVEGARAQDTFEALKARYEHCTVFALQHPTWGSWMGASPEVLLEAVEGGFRSMSLAGTRLKGGLNWGEKELAEQKYVTKEVHRTLSQLGGRVRREAQTTLEAGPVEHLLTWVHTDFDGLDPLAASEALHPTPAVCGSPTQRALTFLAEHEGYDRGLYTGYLAFADGPYLAAVLLRTMRWHKGGICFFAGGGITKDSVPLSEWMETEYKISALKDAVVI